MPRIPVIIPAGGFGSRNPNALASGRSVPKTFVKMPAGVAQSRQRFAGNPKLDPTVARQLDQLQDYIQKSLAVLKNAPFLNGNYLQSVTIAASGNTPLQHGLGRPWVGYMVANIQNNPAGAFFVQRQAGNLDVTTMLVINGAALAFQADFWIW